MPPILHSARLIFRPPGKEDLENFYLLGSNPNVMRYITFGKTLTREEARRDLAKRIKMGTKRFGYWVVKSIEDGTFIGWVTLKPLENTRMIEVGYRLMEAQWGKGYATEATQRLLRYAFEDLNLEEVVAVAMEENTASLRVLEKVGMTFQGYDRFYKTEVVVYKVEREAFLRSV